MTHTFRRIIDIVRQSPAGQMQPASPPNRQLSRTETNMIIQVHGQSQDKPTLLGDDNGADAVQVYATGLYEGVLMGDLRWVTGSAVEAGLECGVLVEVDSLTDDTREQVDASAEHDRAAAQDHITEPVSGAFEQRSPLPEATDVDRALAGMSKSELADIARTIELPGRSAMDKSELYEHLRQHPEVDMVGDVVIGIRPDQT